MDRNDYRNTTYCSKLKGVSEKKLKLKNKIKTEGHMKTDNFYELIRDNPEYKKEYFGIYNYKCAYCGASILLLGTEVFELDHFKNKADHTENINDIFNIILSCKICNRGKSGFNIDNISNLLNPDNNEIAKVFYRDEDYYIRIHEKYLDNEEIKKFYKKLKLNYQIRRLDFLLLNLKGLIDKLENYKIKNKEDIKSKLLSLKNSLQEKRNIIISKEDIK